MKNIYTMIKNAVLRAYKAVIAWVKAHVCVFIATGITALILVIVIGIAVAVNRHSKTITVANTENSALVSSPSDESGSNTPDNASENDQAKSDEKASPAAPASNDDANKPADASQPAKPDAGNPAPPAAQPTAPQAPSGSPAAPHPAPAPAPARRPAPRPAPAPAPAKHLVPARGHWVEKTQRVWVPNVVTIVDKPAWAESKQVFDYVLFNIDGYKAYNEKDAKAHDIMLIKAGKNDSYQMIFRTETTRHPAVTHTEDKGHWENKVVGRVWVIDTPAHWE